MKNTNFLLQLRANNAVLLSVGLLLLTFGIFSVLIVDTTNWWNLALIILGVGVLAFFLAANLTEIKAVGKKRSTLVQANLALVAAAMLGIVGGLNYVISRHPVRFDLTANKFYSLSDQTVDILHKLKQDVNVTLLLSGKRSSPEIGRAQQLLEEYSKKSGKFHFRAVDVDKNPSEAKRLGIHEYNTVVFESGENRKDVLQRDYVTYAMNGRQPTPKFQGEGAFTSALIKMNDTTHLTFYLTQGHGEKDFNNPQSDGFTTFKDMLEKENYTLKTANLLTSGKIPEDAAVLAILGPTRPFQPSEEALIKDYLNKGGKVVLCVDPMIKTGLDSLLNDWSIKLNNDIAVDQTNYAFPDVRVVVPEYRYHTITEKLSESHIATLMPFGRSIQKTDGTLKNVQWSPLMVSSDKGWGETNLKSKALKFDAGVDTKGPVTLAVACEWSPADNPSKKVRLVVFGNSNFFTNQFLQGPGNLDMSLNIFSWAAVEENKISIHPKEDDLRAMNLTNVSANLIKYITVWMMPLAVLAAGTLIWYRRRSM